ncbi:MAG: hypothetical protein HRT72_07980, partial [Flavobacteriales bacterium]|nr:hypothetical protein [Flavobacteriales bacterium]
MKKFWSRIIVTCLFGIVIGSILLASKEEDNDVESLATEIIDEIDSVFTIAEDAPEVPPVFRYGINNEDYKIKEGKIGKNENLSIILRRYGVSHLNIDRIARKSTDVFNLRRIKQGKKYSVFYTEDSVKQAQLVVYQDNAIDFYVFDLRDTMSVYKGAKEVTLERKTAAGI